MKRYTIARICIWSAVILILLCALIFRLAFPYRMWGAEDSTMTPLVLGESIQLTPGDVSALDIDWSSGTITIQAGDVDAIWIREDGAEDEDHALCWKIRNGKLNIQSFRKRRFWGIQLGSDSSKDLTITFPRDWVCHELELDTASADVFARDLTVYEVDVDSASTDMLFENCAVQELDIDTASGSVDYSGTLQELDMDAASGDFSGSLSNTPKELQMDSASGSLELVLPSDAGFTINMDSLSNDFVTDFKTTRRDGRCICGDGRCEIDISGMSSGVTIRKSE